MSVISEATLPHMAPIGCFPANLGTYLGQKSETAFEADPGCAPDPAPANGDYYQIVDLDGDSTICGHPVQVADYMVWNNGGWFPMTPKQTATSFLALSDTPSSFTGAAGKQVEVLATEDGLGFESVAETTYGGIGFTAWAGLRAFTNYFEGQLVHIKAVGSPIYHYKAEVTSADDTGDGGEIIEPDAYTGIAPNNLKWVQQA